VSIDTAAAPDREQKFPQMKRKGDEKLDDESGDDEKGALHF